MSTADKIRKLIVEKGVSQRKLLNLSPRMSTPPKITNKKQTSLRTLLYFAFSGERGILALASDFVDYEPPLGCSHPL